MHLYPLLKGIIIGLLIAVPAGPVGFLCASVVLTHHWRASVASVLGCISADLIFGFITIFGLTSVSYFFTHEQNAIKFLGGLLLIYVGIKTFFDIPPALIPGLEKYEHLGNFTSTFSLTMTNPIQIIILPVVFTAIGTDVRPGYYGEATLFLLGLAVGSCLCWILLMSIISFFKKYLKEHHFQLINRISGGLITGVGFFIFMSLILSRIN